MEQSELLMFHTFDNYKVKIMDANYRFQFNFFHASRTICSIVILSAVFISIVLVTDNKITRFFEVYIFFQYFFLALIIIFPIAIFFRWLRAAKELLHISIEESSISIPNIFLIIKKYKIENIYSVEYLKANKTNVGIILGIRNAPRIFVDKKIFRKEKEFVQFFEILKQKIIDSVGEECVEISSQLSEQQVSKNSVFINSIAGMLALFYLLSLFSSYESSPSEDFLLLAANTKAIFSDLEIYRIVSSFFFHTRPLHFTLNVMVLGLIGPPLERAISTSRLISIVLLANIVAVMTSNFFSPFDASIGSSGGIFGLWGALLCLKLKYERFLPASVNLLPTKRLVLILLIELIVEVFFLTNVDYFSHIGGFIAGFVFVFFAPLGSKLEYAGKPNSREKTLSYMLMAFYILAMCYFIYEAGLFFRALALSNAA